MPKNSSTRPKKKAANEPSSRRQTGQKQRPQSALQNESISKIKGLFAEQKKYKTNPNEAVTEAFRQLNVFAEVLAVPGSGKTTALLARIDWLLASGVPAERILVLSFAKKSVAHFQSLLSPQAERVQVTTGHAFGLKVVKVLSSMQS